jgi:lipid-A-disaccharide synthase
MKKILIITGEASGDLHGANLVQELKKKNNNLVIFGVGSKRLQEAGVDLLADASEISVVGATEVVTHIGPIYRVYSRLKQFLREELPALVILVDFPDFNILIGKAARKLNIPVVYYISPQVWAWRKGRIKTIASLVRAMIVIFPFEEEMYRRAGVDVRYVGHPLTDVVQSRYNQAEAKALFGMEPAKQTVALLPGSRIREIESLLPDMLGAAGLLMARFPDLQFILPVAPTLSREFVRSFIARTSVPVVLVDGQVYDALRASDAALVASGTATLETGLMTVPMVIVYRVSGLSYFIGRQFIKVDNVGLVNIIAGKRVVPELIQDDATPEKMAGELGAFLTDREYCARVKADLAGVRLRLGETGANARAAAVVLDILKDIT